MSVLTYPPANDEEIFKHCTKECGVITATDDQQYFALGCLFCAEKFLYFDAFIGHMQTVHSTIGLMGQQCLDGGAGFGAGVYNTQPDNLHGVNGGGLGNCPNGIMDDLPETDPALLEPQMVMIKEEALDEDFHDDDLLITGMPTTSEMADIANGYYRMKQDSPTTSSGVSNNCSRFMPQNYGNYMEESNNANDAADDDEEPSNQEDDDDDTHYDDLVEESLLGGPDLALHIKDRKMIKFLIDAYRVRSFLWDHHHPQFRDRVRRQQFLEWIMAEFKKRFNLSLAKDAVTRKWDNLRTVYKRECNRMAQERTNVSTLWYFKELSFLNRLYGVKTEVPETVIKEFAYRRRYSALWNDVSTTKLLEMVKKYPCFYDKFHIDYRSKEKRGEALQKMAAELQKMMDVSTIQISKRISQLRFDYSKQKYDRLVCEQTNKVFVPSYTYYEQMFFMDADVAPFKCGFCPVILQTTREMEMHLESHQGSSDMNGGTASESYTNQNSLGYYNNEQSQQSLPPQQQQQQQQKMSNMVLPDTPQRYYCDLCTANFREKSNFDEHMRRHNDELLLPALASAMPPAPGSISAADAAAEAAAVVPVAVARSIERPYTCEVCGKSFAHSSTLSSHRALHASERMFKCDYAHCTTSFSSRQSMLDHMRIQHASDDDYKCDVCGKGFKSSKNLQNHRQIHDAVKRYVCKICGSAFAQAAGLYLHKRRHNRPNSRMRQNVF